VRLVFKDFFETAVSAINQRHNYNERLSLLLQGLKSVSAPNKLETIVVGVNKKDCFGAVAGVDSGFIHKKLSFIDLAIIKTAGVLFTYEGGKLVKTDYYPAAFSLPEPVLLGSGLEADEETQSLSLVRLKAEVSCSIEMIQKYKPKFMFIDGSIVPQYQDKPRTESELNDEYYSIIDLFEKLYGVAQEYSCSLVACVEDSRGARFKQILQEEILPNSALKVDASLLKNSFDASLLDYYLRAGERTFAFPYTNKIVSHAILKDYDKKWAENIFVFYIKSTEFDKPLRVEFLCNNSQNAGHFLECVQNIASIVYSLSSLHKEYSFPSVLIEADLRAGLNEQDISIVYDRLVDRLGSKVRMRRSNRPFG